MACSLSSRKGLLYELPLSFLCLLHLPAFFPFVPMVSLVGDQLIVTHSVGVTVSSVIFTSSFLWSSTVQLQFWSQQKLKQWAEWTLNYSMCGSNLGLHQWRTSFKYICHSRSQRNVGKIFDMITGPAGSADQMWLVLFFVAWEHLIKLCDFLPHSASLHLTDYMLNIFRYTLMIQWFLNVSLSPLWSWLLRITGK